MRIWDVAKITIQSILQKYLEWFAIFYALLVYCMTAFFTTWHLEDTNLFVFYALFLWIHGTLMAVFIFVESSHGRLLTTPNWQLAVAAILGFPFLWLYIYLTIKLGAKKKE